MLHCVVRRFVARHFPLGSRIPAIVSRAMSGAEAFQAIIAEAGLDEDASEYLAARGITTAAVLARCATSEEQRKQRIVNPFVAGWIKGEKTHKSQLEDFIVEASFIVAWERATKTNKEFFQTAQSQQHAQPADAATTCNGGQPNKIPTELRTGEWAKRVDAFQNAFQPARAFPQQLLVGAEKVLARMIHESEESKNYTPVTLGEILEARAFTALGDPNPLATKKKKNKLEWRDDHFGYSQDDFVPLSIWSLNDALEAIKWAFVFAGYSLDEVAGFWTDFFRRELRKHPKRPDMIRNLYETWSWKLAMAMRGGETFEVATKAIVADTAMLNDFVNNSPSDVAEGKGRNNDRGRGSQRSRSRSDGRARWRDRKPANDDQKSRSGPKGKDKSKGKGDKGRRVCSPFQRGPCGRNGVCAHGDLHKCRRCGQGGHGAADCRVKR